VHEDENQNDECRPVSAVGGNGTDRAEEMLHLQAVLSIPPSEFSDCDEAIIVGIRHVISSRLIHSLRELHNSLWRLVKDIDDEVSWDGKSLKDFRRMAKSPVDTFRAKTAWVFDEANHWSDLRHETAQIKKAIETFSSRSTEVIDQGAKKLKRHLAKGRRTLAKALVLDDILVSLTSVSVYKPEERSALENQIKVTLDEIRIAANVAVSAIAPHFASLNAMKAVLTKRLILSPLRSNAPDGGQGERPTQPK